MPIILLGAFILIVVADFVELFWRSPRDPTWETRWRALDPAESSWLAFMASSRSWLASLTDPGEIELARGFRRQENRRRIYLDLAVASPLVIGAAVLALAGVLPTSTLGIVLGFIAIVRGLLVYRRERQIKRTYEGARTSYAGQSEPAPTA